MAKENRVRKVAYKGYLISAKDATKIHRFMAKFDITLDTEGLMAVKDPIDDTWKTLRRSDLVKMVIADKKGIGIAHIKDGAIPTYVDFTILVVSKAIQRGGFIVAEHEVPYDIPALEVDI